MSRAALNRPFMHLLIVVVAAAVWMMIAMVPGNSHDLPLQSVVGGHRLQPSEQELNAIGRPDVTTPESDEIDQLYGTLLHCAKSACTSEVGAPANHTKCDPAAAARSFC